MTSPALVTRILPARRAARQAVENFASQLSSSDEGDKYDVGPKASGDPARKKGTASKSYGRRGKHGSGKQHGESTHPVPSPIADQTAGKKRRLPFPDLSSSSDNDTSPPISSPAPSRLAPKLRKSVSSIFPKTSSRSKGGPSNLPNEVSTLRKATSSTPLKGSSSALPLTIQSSPTHSPHKKPRPVEEIWDLEKCDSFVWVLLDERGTVTQEGEGEDSDGVEGENMWWPGKVKDSNPLRIHLYGEVTTRTVTLLSPSPQTLQPMTTALQKLRFDSSNFLCAHRPRLSASSSIHASPKKKRKRDNSGIGDKWQAAVDDMVAEYIEEDDGLPSVALAFIPSRGGVNKAKEKDSVSDEEAIRDNIDNGRYSEQELLVGELVYARDSRSREYWPAKIEEFIPPKTLNGKPKYFVKYMDGTTRKIYRNWFYADWQPEFATCREGLFISNNEDSDGGNYSDDGSFLVERARSPSPLPIEPVPPTSQFLRLPIRAQFAYAKPVLTAILNEGYEPAITRHGSYLKGGKSRSALAANVTMRGNISEKEVKKMEKCLLDWVLRDARNPARRMEEVGNDGEESACGSGSGRVQMTGVDGSFEHTSPSTVALGLPSSPAPVPPSSFSTVDVPTEVKPQLQHATAEQHHLYEPDDIQADTVQPSTSRLDSGSHRLIPQRGCEAYEALTVVEKIGYVQDVLQPEAIIQLLLWRNGKRTSLELLDSEEEGRLHDIGLKLSEEPDWVDDIRRLRESKVRNMEKQKGKEKETPLASTPVSATPMGGTRSRPKKSR